MVLRQRILASLCVGTWLCVAPAAGAPRVVSINLCTDQLLLSLADPDQILGLSPYARDAARSFGSGLARDLPILSGTAEEIVAIRPDLVLAGRFTKRVTRDLVRRYGFHLVEFDPPRSVEDAIRQMRVVAGLLGHPERAETAIARIEAAVARARVAAASRPVTVLPLQRRGWIAGGDTLLASLLGIVGLRNAGASLSDGLGRQVTLETIVQLRPDRLLVSNAEGRADDQGSALLQHPALMRLYPPESRIVLPERLTVSCGGPSLAETVERLTAELAKLGP